MMGKRDKRGEVEKVLDVDASMQGSLIFKDPVNLRINGNFEGTLNTKGNLTIGEDAVVNADITGDSIVIAGRVNGTIRSLKDLKLTSTASVTGDVSTPRLSVTEGALLDGTLKMSDDPAKSAGEGLMTPEDLAKYLEIDTSVVFDWARSGKIPSIRDGSSLIFERSKIEEWVATEKIK